MKKLKCKKEYGEWFYRKITDYDLDAPIYELYDHNKVLVDNFGSYGDMKYYAETREYL
jgi:hypothetical protein